MDRERAKELLPIIEAFAEGKEIEVRAVDSGFPDWGPVDLDEGMLCMDSCEYRIKPEPRTWWLSKKYDVTGARTYTDIPPLISNQDHYIKVIEVL